MTRVVRVIAAVVAVLGVAIWLILNLLSPVSFCDIVLVLDAALDTGEDIYRAMEDFFSQVNDTMVMALPDDIRRPGEVLVQVVDGLLSGPLSKIRNYEPDNQDL